MADVKSVPRAGVIYAVDREGHLLWYKYEGNGEVVRSPSAHWHTNSSNRIGNGWQDFRYIVGYADGVILAVQQNSDLLWYKYDGNGEKDPSGRQGWHPNSGNLIGHDWQSFHHVFASGRTIFSVLARLWRW